MFNIGNITRPKNNLTFSGQQMELDVSGLPSINSLRSLLLDIKQQEEETLEAFLCCSLWNESNH